MSLCIFCLEEKELTEEHVFPAALGGGLAVPDSVCEKDNNGFSKAFEQVLFQELRPIRLTFQIPDRYGVVPAADATIHVGGEKFAGRVQSDGVVQVKPVVKESRGPDGSRELHGAFLTEAIKKDWAAKVDEGKFIVIDAPSGGPIEAEVHVGGDLEICSGPEGLRNAAKIAFVGLAYKFGVKTAQSKAFDAVRAFILTGEGEKISRLFIADRFMEAVQIGPHQHSIILAARNRQRRVDAIVRLFGGMCYFVNLSATYDGVDFYNTLAYDASRGEINGTLQTVLDAEFRQIEDVANSNDTVWDDRTAWGKRLTQFMDAAAKAYAERKAKPPKSI
jgi:hypothetical protein